MFFSWQNLPRLLLTLNKSVLQTISNTFRFLGAFFSSIVANRTTFSFFLLLPNPGWNKIQESDLFSRVFRENWKSGGYSSFFKTFSFQLVCFIPYDVSVQHTHRMHFYNYKKRNHAEEPFSQTNSRGLYWHEFSK